MGAVVNGQALSRGAGGPVAGREPVIVWIDAREAVVVRWKDEAALLERLDSEVPDHRRSTGHVRHVPSIRHGGGGAPQTADEPHRLEHLARFLDDVATRLSEDEEIAIIGPGTVHQHLERRLRELDERRGRTRSISAVRSPRLTERQLASRLRELRGIPARRRTVGA